MLADGLYRVETPTFVAGFVIREGQVARCAPILARRLRYWLWQGKLVEPLPSPSEAESLLTTPELLSTPEAKAVPSS